MTSGLPRVAMVIAQYAPVVGGAERACERLAIALAARGHEVHVVTRRPPDAPADELRDGVHIHRIAVPAGRVAAGVAFIARAAGWLLRHAPDVVHCHQALSPGTIGALYRLVGRAPVLVKLAGSGHTGDVHQARILPLTALRRALLRRITGFICPSEQLARELTDFLGPVRHWVIGNALDTSSFAPLPAPERDVMRARLGLGGRALLFAGALRPEKNLVHVVRALRHLAADVHLWVVGDGAEREPALALARELGVADRLHLAGAVKDVLPWLQSADALVLPSISEGMSNALLEAMSTALPVLASRIEGNAALIEEGVTGAMFALDDPADLARVAAHVFAAPESTARQAAAARARVVAAHDLDLVTTRYQELYSELLS